MKIRKNLRDGGFTKTPKLFILSLRVHGFAETGVKIRFNLRRGISRQGPKIVIFCCSCSTFLFDAFEPCVKIRMNPRNGGLTKRHKVNISS